MIDFFVQTHWPRLTLTFTRWLTQQNLWKRVKIVTIVRTPRKKTALRYAATLQRQPLNLTIFLLSNCYKYCMLVIDEQIVKWVLLGSVNGSTHSKARSGTRSSSAAVRLEEEQWSSEAGGVLVFSCESKSVTKREKTILFLYFWKHDPNIIDLFV